MRVTCRHSAVPAYYSGRDGNPKCEFEPGDIGVVKAVDVPCVTHAYQCHNGTATFICVDFEKAGRAWRCSLFYNNIRIVKDGEESNKERDAQEA
jgi:hypothetical protein